MTAQAGIGSTWVVYMMHQTVEESKEPKREGSTEETSEDPEEPTSERP